MEGDLNNADHFLNGFPNVFFLPCNVFIIVCLYG